MKKNLKSKIKHFRPEKKNVFALVGIIALKKKTSTMFLLSLLLIKVTAFNIANARW